MSIIKLEDYLDKIDNTTVPKIIIDNYTINLHLERQVF